MGASDNGEHLHIEIGDDDFAENGEKEPAVEAVVADDLVRVQGREAVPEREQAEQEVQAVRDEKCLLYSAHRGVSVNLAQLGQDEVLVDQNVEHEAELVQQIEDQQHRHDPAVVQVRLERYAGLKGEVEVADDEFDLILHSLHYFEHLGGRLPTFRAVLVAA